MTIEAGTHEVVKASDEVIGIKVMNHNHEDLGKISEILLDKLTGQVAYLVLKSGSFLGIGGKLLALPWKAISYDPSEECFILKMDKDKLKSAPNFDQDSWPDTTDREWESSINKYYGAKNYWE